MSAAQQVKLIGRTGLLRVTEDKGDRSKAAMHVPVTVTDVRVAWGKTRYLVAPVNGSGMLWVDSTRVELDA